MSTLEALIQVAVQAKKMRDYLATQVGETDDWPCSIVFDSEEEAHLFTELVQDLDEAVETIELLTSF